MIGKGKIKKQIYIFYPSLRIYLASVLSNIKKIYCYPLFKSKNLHLVNAAKEFTEKSLKIKNCPTETKFFINKVEIDNINKKFSMHDSQILDCDSRNLKKIEQKGISKNREDVVCVFFNYLFILYYLGR